VNPRRYQRRQQIQLMDVERDYQAIYRLTAMLELPWEYRLGWNLAFYRSFAVPRMAALLAHTGEIEQRTMKRARDTGLMMYELFEQGLDHPRSREVIRRLNRMHRRWDIEPEDYRYILTTFAVVPTRFADRFGWRAVSAPEREATWRFYRDLGRRMAIGSIPGSYPAMAAFLDEYEAREVRYSPQGAHLTDLTLPFLAAKVPSPLREYAPEIAGALLDARLRSALGLPAPRRRVDLAVRSALAARRAVVRRRAPQAQSWFTAGMANATYPEGYQLGDLGPPAG
jgi:hypothetical protein